MTLPQLIALRIRKMLKEREWTQYKLAERSGIPDSTLSNVLQANGKSVTTETLLNICRGFDISLTMFFDDEMFDPENIADD